MTTGGGADHQQNATCAMYGLLIQTTHVNVHKIQRGLSLGRVCKISGATLDTYKLQLI